MSSSDRAFFRRWAAAPALALAGLLALSACTVQTLYGNSPAGKAVDTAIASIGIEPVTTRVAQVVRNRLIFDLAGGQEPAAPAYRMRLNVSTSEAALGVTPIESAPAYSLTVSATYEIRSVATGEIVLRGTSRGNASFDRVTQLYANTRASLDAEDRAAGLAAEDIRVRLSVAASKGTL